MSAYLTYKLWKALVLLALAFFACFLYTLFTGKTPGQAPPDTPPNPEDRERP